MQRRPDHGERAEYEHSILWPGCLAGKCAAARNGFGALCARIDAAAQMARQLRGGATARSRQRAQDPTIYLRFKSPTDAGNILVAQNAGHRVGAPAARTLSQMPAEEERRRLVVRHVEDPFDRAGHDLKAPRQVDVRKRGAHQLTIERARWRKGFHGRERGRDGSKRRSRPAAQRDRRRGRRATALGT